MHESCSPTAASMLLAWRNMQVKEVKKTCLRLALRNRSTAGSPAADVSSVESWY